MKAMILAAGLGTRLRPITHLYAKPAVPFLNVPMLYYSLELLDHAGATDFVINSHFRAEQIRKLTDLAPGLKHKANITFEADRPLGSGGGIWNARKFLNDENFWLANGDEVILPQDLNIFRKLKAKHLQSGALATILVMKHPLVGTQFGGVWADDQGVVRGFGKSGEPFGAGLNGHHYIGLQIIHRRVFDYLPEGESNILYDAFTRAIASGEKIEVLDGSFTWFETGNPKDFVDASVACMELLSEPQRANGDDRRFLMRVLERFSDHVVGDQIHWHLPGSEIPKSGAVILAARDAKISKDAKLQGHVVLGRDAKIEGTAKVQDSVVLDGAVVRAGEEIVRAIRT